MQIADWKQNQLRRADVWKQ